jgi:hypothetical protein
MPGPAKRGWFARNWLWLIPSGCLAMILVIGMFSAVIAIGVFGVIKSTDTYKVAVRRAEADPRVIQALGTPINESWFVGGHTQVDGGAGKSDLAIPIRGPKGSATVYAEATKSEGEWHYSKLVAKVDKTGQIIDLTESADNSSE